jgi:uroporphyrinogen decarboxylase
MGEHDDRWKAMLFEGPEYVPVGVHFLPATWMRHRQELDALVRRHPVIFGADQPDDRDYDAITDVKYTHGPYTDAWGCVWETLRAGIASMVTHHPVPTRRAVRTLTAPEEDIGLPHGFMYLRLSDLRGFEELMLDFAEEPPELQRLIDVVLEYNVRQMEKLLAEQTQPSILNFGDDLGMQTSLPMSPQKWRQHLKPCYARLYGMVRRAGHYVYMHSDGHFWEVIPDLVECGVNVINPQFRANGLESLAAVCKGRVCVDLDLDRQMMPFCTPADLDAHVRACVEALGAPAGGLWLKGECGPDVPLANIEAICAAMERYRGWFGSRQP